MNKKVSMIFNAPNIGMDKANQVIQAYGGSMDTEKYYFIMKSNTLSYQIGGGICSLVGGIGALLLVPQYNNIVKS